MRFNHSLIENKIKILLKNKDFYELNKNSHAPKFSIILPPPNVTGHLHLGHAWDASLQDAIIRYKHLQGYNTLWIFGLDHAGIATQTKFEKILKNKTNKDHNDLGKKKFLIELKKWVDQQKKFIKKQLNLMNLSLSYESQCFTLDDHVNKAVSQIFVDLYNQKLIYQDYKLVNWDTSLKTAISDIEVNYKKCNLKMYYLKYFFVNKKKYLVVATTRPETLFGDVCLVVNPKDKRNSKYIDQKVINPINQKIIPIIGDEYVDFNFGTGVMKCTPAHDFNDYAIAKKHKINFFSIFDSDGTLNDKAIDFNHTSYKGIKIIQAREMVIKLLDNNHLIIKVDNVSSNVAFSDRTDTIVEPLLSKQWFIKMKPLVKKVISLQKSTKRVNFFPKRFSDELLKWVNNIQDWCISRQLWWGHQIPVWYHTKTKKTYVGINPPKQIRYWKRDDDVLDTWFSSGLWPMVCTFWRKEIQYKKFYPTSCLVTGYDILFFWVVRMLAFGTKYTKIMPFNECLIHGLVRDKLGRKMSKSLGNGIDPIDLVKKYGSDAVKLFFTSSTTMGEDIKFDEQKIKYYSTILNKIWNSYQLIKNNGLDLKNFTINQTSEIDKWMINKLIELQKTIFPLYDKYEFTIANKKLIDSFWNIYCNQYLELIKPNLNVIDKNKLQKLNALFIFNEYLKLFYPIIPAICEYIFYDLNKSYIWNSRAKILNFNLEYDKNLIDTYIQIFYCLQNYRFKNSIKKNEIIEFDFVCHLQINLNEINNYLKVNNLVLKKFITKPNNEKNKTILTIDNGLIIIAKKNTNSNINIKKYLLFLDNEIARAKSLLNNKNFILKAPKEKVNLEKEKLEKYLLEKQNLNNLKK